MDITINAKNIDIRPNSNRSIELNIEGVDQQELLDLFSIDDFIEHFGADEIIKYIPQQIIEDNA